MGSLYAWELAGMRMVLPVGKIGWLEPGVGVEPTLAIVLMFTTGCYEACLQPVA